MKNKPLLRLFYPALSILLSGLLLAGFVAGSAQGAARTPWQSKVDAWALETASAGETEFLLFLSEQADLSEAARLPTKLEKGIFVYERLSETARRTQGPLIAALDELQRSGSPALEYQPFWVVNAIWVRADAQALETLARRADVAHIYANPAVRLVLPEQTAQPLAPDEAAGIEWNVQKISAPQAWAAGFFGQGAVIGGQDTGYDWNHPALKNQYRGWNGLAANHNYNWHDAVHSGGGVCGANSPVPCDDSSHGTHTMGTMVGDDGANQIGVAPRARWIGCRNMNQGVGTPATYLECYQWFVAPTNLSGNAPRPDLAPDVINNSWSCPGSEGCTDPNILKSAVENLRLAGIVTVHSAGNSGSSCYTIDTPAAIYEASFTVGATDSKDIITTFSSRGSVSADGSNRLKPDVSAPGENVRSSVPGAGYSLMNGTSMAAPHVAGAIGLLISAYPELAGHPDEIEYLISRSAIPRTTSQLCGGVPGSQTPNNTYGWGRIDAWQAIQEFNHELLISKKPNLPFYQPGWTITYTLQVTFAYPLTPTYNVRITDILPAHTQFVTATLPHTLTGGAVVWGLPSLGPNATHQVKLIVRASETYTGVITNQGYSVSSSDLPAAFGPPVSIFWANRFNYLPRVGR